MFLESSALLVAAAAIAAPAAAQAPARQRYDLPAQPLAKTLLAISRESRREVLFAPEAVEGRTAAPLKGELTLDEALARTLADTGLVVEQKDRAVLIHPAGPDQPFRPEANASAIVVTGTHIRGGGSASPVIVETRERLEHAGISDLTGFARALPQNYTGGQFPGIVGGGEQGGQSNVNNSTNLNLRGLGPDATLTLINGHRIAYDALAQGVDIGALPLRAIDRIEVIADGASALYGSDAVGGVANIILRRDMDGAEASARIGAATDGGDVQQQYDLAGGGRWDTGGLMFALEYQRGTAINADDRSYTKNLDASATLLPRQRQISGVLTGHQRLFDWLEFSFDGEVSDRHSQKSNVFFTTSDVFTNGLYNRVGTTEWSATPSLRADLPFGWQATASATRGISRTRINGRFALEPDVTLTAGLYENRLTDLEASTEGPLWELPGGAVRLALGGGYRSLALYVNSAQTAGGVTTTTRDFTERRKVAFGYGELAVPLVGAANARPLLQRLSVDAALRYERYSGLDHQLTPKLGLVYAPDRAVTIKATWGRSFKMPTLYQVYQPQSGALFSSTDYDPLPDPPLPATSTVLELAGGNPNLTSERATTWTAGAELRPASIPGLKLEANYFDVTYRDRIVAPISSTYTAFGNPDYSSLILFDPGAELVSRLIADLPGPLENLTGRPVDPANVAAIIDGALRNTAREHPRGVDLSGEYDAAAGPDDHILFTLSASYLKNDRKLLVGQVPAQLAGTIFNPPHWRGRFGSQWRHASVMLSGFVNYLGSTLDNRLQPFVRIGSFVTLDAVAELQSAGTGPLGDVSARLSVLNLLNKKPDVIRNSNPASPPFDSTNQSSIGRFIAFQLSKKW